jgi:mannose-6-phosphate isomerase-like protein (cupin superfamily)
MGQKILDLYIKPGVRMNQVTDIHSALHAIWGKGCDSWVLVDQPDLSVKQERMPPGTSEVTHYHQYAQQFFYVLNGKATFYIQEQKQDVQAQQGIYIEPGVQHLISNETTEQLEFLVISQPSTKHDRIEL